jgi:hypothetical protein
VAGDADAAVLAQEHGDAAIAAGVARHDFAKRREDADHGGRRGVGLRDIHAVRQAIRVVAQIDLDAAGGAVDRDVTVIGSSGGVPEGIADARARAPARRQAADGGDHARFE